jgi:hypothetical protein
MKLILIYEHFMSNVIVDKLVIDKSNLKINWNIKLVLW